MGNNNNGLNELYARKADIELWFKTHNDHIDEVIMADEYRIVCEEIEQLNPIQCPN